ncbi:hypothetical protein BGZ83_005126 [Gryganskiella cystojenkinii]|nr:hypothetical protein BGZ83_005126 [Gryganskiella cystojenkinii]
MDLSHYATLLKTAKAEHEAGDLRSAYGSYIKAHAAIIRILGTQVVFKDRDSIDSLPINHSQLNAHAQEILRRLNDIVEAAKKHTTKTTTSSATTTSTVSATSVTTGVSTTITSSAASSTLGTTTTIPRPGLPPAAPSQRSIATTATTTLNRRTKRNIPMIPISPLTKQALLHSYTLSQVTARFEQAKQGDGSPSLSTSSAAGSRDLANLRRLIEDVRIQRAKLDAVNVQIQSVATSTVTSWDPELMAKQLTIIDTMLFKDVSIPKDLVRTDRSLSAARRCIDFENYIAHSMAHQLLQEWSTSRQHSSTNSPTPTSSTSISKGHAHNAPHNAVAHLTRVAQILLHVYRNFNSFMAVMRALTSPEIKRMHRIWSGVPSKTKDLFKRLSAIYYDHGELRGYQATLTSKLASFQDIGKGALVAIPWMRYHQDEVKSIINSYLTGHESSGEIVLSAPGARKLSAVATLLTHCRTNDSNLFDRPELDNSKATQSAQAKNREPMVVDGIRAPLVPIWDLVSLGTGEVTLHHWLVSRPYLNKQQLIDESLEIEPLFNGEEIACYERALESDDDESLLSGEEEGGVGDDDDTFEHVIAPEHDLEPLPRPSLPISPDRPMLARSPVSETELNDIMNELLNDDDASDSKGLFGDSGASDNEPDGGDAAGSSSAGSGPKSSPSARNQDVLKFLGIDAEEEDSDRDEDDRHDGGDISVSQDRGKGRKLEPLDEDEISALMAQVKGLVRESNMNADAVEASFNRSNLEEKEVLATEFESKDDETAVSPSHAHSDGRKFEPFKQEPESDSLSLHKDNISSQDAPPSDPLGLGLKREVLPAAVTPPPRSLFSLEAMRMQLQNLDKEPDSREEITKSSTDAAKIENAKEPSSLESESSISSSRHQSPALKDMESPSSPPTATSTGNPFAPYMKVTSPVSSPENLSTSPLAKGRRRKIQVDRSNHSLLSETIPQVLSSPKPVISFGFEHQSSPADPQQTMAEIEAKAKLSLASHAALTEAIARHTGTDTDEQIADVDEIIAQSEAAKKQDMAASSVADKEEPSLTAAVTVQDVDKHLLGGSVEHSESNTLTTTISRADIATTIQAANSTSPSVVPADIVKNSTSEFTLADNLFDGAINQDKNPQISKTDDHAEGDSGLGTETIVSVQSEDKDKAHEQQKQQVLSDGDHSSDMSLKDRHDRSQLRAEGDMSPPSDHPHGRARSRQRRRIAGGVIQLPQSSKTLLSMSSTGSLSSAFQAGASSSETMMTTATTTTTSTDEILKHNEYETPGQQETMITTTALTILNNDQQEVKEKQEEEESAVRAVGNADIVTKTIVADVAEVDVTASEVSSMVTKSLPVEEGQSATMALEPEEEAQQVPSAVDQDDPTV